MGNRISSLLPCCDSKTSGETTASYRPVGGYTGTTTTSIPQGTRVNLLKQDPSVQGIGYRQVWLAEDVRSGPSTSEIVIAGLGKTVTPTSYADNDFLYDIDKDPLEFDAVNNFTIVHQVLTMYRRSLLRLDVQKELEWNWGSAPIRVLPRAGEWENAYYSRDEKVLAFFYFKNPSGIGTVYTCRSYDIVAHETGHAILDALKPNWLVSTKPQCGALHEAFGDLTAIFALLDQLDMCEAVISLSKGCLHDRHFLPLIGEEFGTALGIGFGLRNADNDLTLDSVSDEVHDLSRVFTGAVYDILVDMYEIARNVEKYDPAETLYRTGKHLAGVFMIAILKSPNMNCSFGDLAKEMMKATPNTAYQSVMQKEFEKRKIFDTRARANIVEASITSDLIKQCCATMTMLYDNEKMTEIKKVIQEDLAKNGELDDIENANVAQQTEQAIKVLPKEGAQKVESETKPPTADTEEVKLGDSSSSDSSKHASKEDIKTEDIKLEETKEAKQAVQEPEPVEPEKESEKKKLID